MDEVTETQRVPASRRGLTRRAAGHHLAIELRETAKLALPMVLTQVGQIAMMTTDLAFVGRIGVEALAAAALASRVYFVSFAFGMGLLAAIVPLAAQAFGADNLGVIRRSLRMGLWAALVLSIPIMACALHGEQILLALGQAPDTARLAQQYLLGLAWGVAPALWFQVIRSFMGAVNRPEPVGWIMLSVSTVHALLVYPLIYGKFGLPRLELFGVGLATSLANCATFLAGLWFVIMRRPFRDYRVIAHLWRFDWFLMWQLIVIGTPIAIGSLIESGLFSAASLLAGLIGTRALAAHQIALQVAAILFMTPSGISMAAAVRVGHAVGRNDGPGIKRAGLTAILLGIAIVAMLTVAVVAARFEIAELFLGKSARDADATIGLAANLLSVGASVFISDAVEIIAAGGLRGLKDTRMPLLFAGIAYWLIGFSLSYALGLKIGLGAIGIWIGLSIGSAVYAGLLVLRFQLLANRLALQSRCLAA
ncbi:MATE family efflux transporter [Bradyrhizobium sp. Pha-3]|uniref:MATE family efflux transporter n=1 Tax=Bradyrhizobium sp. Pha-3 TaxID=208375 RepID=UPI0035D43627